MSETQDNIVDADWDVARNLVKLFQNQAQQVKQPQEAKEVAAPEPVQEIRFTGFKDKKKGSSNKKKRGNASAAKSPYVPLFDEDSDGNIIVNDDPKEKPSLQSD